MLVDCRRRGRGVRWARRRPVRSASASTASLRLGEDGAEVERRDDDPADPGAVGQRSHASVPPGADRREVEPVLAQDAGQVGRRALALGRHHDPVALGQERAELAGDGLGVPRRRPPSPRVDTTGRVGRVRRGRQRPRGAGHAVEQALGREVQPREALDVVGLPRAGQRAGQVGFLGQHVGGPVPQPLAARPGSPGPSPAGGRSAGRSPSTSHGSQLSIPSNVRPSASRSHCSRPHGSAATRRSALRRTSAVASSSRAGHDHRLLHRVGRALVVDGELGQPVHLVAPEVDADRRVRGRREDVDDRAAPGHLAAVLDQLLTAVARRHQPGQQRPRHPGSGRAGSTTGSMCSSPGTEPLQQGPDAADDHPGPAAASSSVRGARAPGAAGPWSPRWGSPARRAASPRPGRARRRRAAGTAAGPRPAAARRCRWGRRRGAVSGPRPSSARPG